MHGCFQSCYLQTDIPDFRQMEMEVYRRFSDFLGLHEKLVVKHLHQGRIIPPAPEKSVIGEVSEEFCGACFGNDCLKVVQKIYR